MGELDSQDEAEQTFNLELTASEIYSLQTLLNYMTVDMEREHAMTAQIFSKKINEVVASDSFNSAMETEMDEFKEQYSEKQSPQIPGLSQSKSFQ
jgi:nitric oxide reductase large subunit